MKLTVLAITFVLAIVISSNLSLAAYGPSKQSPQQTTTTTSTATTPNTTYVPATQQTVETTITSDESRFKCSNLPTMKERIACRINLKHENELNYLPEECRVLSGSERAICINNYKSTNQCFQQTTDSSRLNCARRALGLQVADIQKNRDSCAGNQTCLIDLKNKVFTLIKFRFYNLEEKAQKLKEIGVTEDTVAGFIEALELKKQQFNSGTIDEKKQVVKDVINLWKQLVEQAKAEIGEK